MVKNRSLEIANFKLNNIEKLISDKLKEKKKINIFEAGCGYGRVMIELRQKFGNKINIMGINRIRKHGTTRKMIKTAIEEGFATKEELKKMKLPKIIYGDVSKKIPLKSDSIDLVYSQTASFYFPDKLHFFEEVARVLKKDGICRATGCDYLDEAPDGLKNILRIYDDGKIILFKDYMKKYKNIKQIKLNNGKKFLQITSAKLKFDAELISTINIRDVSKINGVQSTYSLKKYNHTSTK
jgi:ubiquinone/menaquinone biosynthesis C-methylase UbiE